MHEVRITLYSHFFKLQGMTPRFHHEVIRPFLKRRVLWKSEYNRQTRRNEWKVDKVFAAFTDTKSEYRIHINDLEDFKQAMKFAGFPESSAQWFQMGLYEPVRVQHFIKPHLSLYDYQQPIVEYLKSPEDTNQKLLALQTGKGKSLSTMWAIADMGVRYLLVIKPGYVDKWIEDIERSCDIDKKRDIVSIAGAKSLLETLDLASKGMLDCKIVIISNRTMQNWFRLYEMSGAEHLLEMGYACTPEDFCQTLGIGVRVIDEVHQDFHLNFMLDMYTHVPHAISLSATLINKDRFMVQMYELAYPPRWRNNGPAYHKYIEATAVLYNFQEPRHIRYLNPVRKSYSHTRFEQSVLGRPKTRANYFAMINQIVRKGFFNREYKAGNRALIFCATIEMCRELAAYLARMHPGHTVKSYVENDPFDNTKAEIIVSTLGSAGTALDIAQLTTVILTVAIDSPQGNIQGFGRLRELKDGATPNFYYFACTDIQKHMNYHEEKRKLLKGLAKGYDYMMIPQSI